MKKRTFGLTALRFVGASALALLVLAYSDHPAAGSHSDGAEPRGGDLVVASLERRPASLEPHTQVTAEGVSLVRTLWRGLFTLDHKNNPQPAMASHPPRISADGRTYTITLRTGLQWSDGNDLTAEDFEMGIKRTCNPVNASSYQWLVTNIVGCDEHFRNGSFDQALEDAIGVNAVTPTKLQINLTAPRQTFTIILSLWMTFPMPVHLVPTTSTPWPANPASLAYNGPYVLTQYGTDAVLAPNAHWAAPARISPSLASLTIKFMTKAEATAAFEAGQLDFANVDPAQLSRIPGQYGREYVRLLDPSTRGLEMQLNHPVLGKPDVRFALSKSIDRAALNAAAYSGAHQPTTTWLPATTFGPQPNAFQRQIGFDPVSARQHLAAAGYPNGAGFPNLSILVEDTPQTVATGEYLQQTFRDVLNIETTVEVVDGVTRKVRFSNEQFELFPGGWIEDYPDPENWFVGQFDKDGDLNKYNCEDTQIHSLIDQAKTERNNSRRIRLYQRANELLVTRLCGVAPYHHENHHYLIGTDVEGMRENVSAQDAAIAGDWIAEAWGLHCDGGHSNNSCARPPTAATPLKIGAVFPFTGALAGLGPQFRNGAELAKMHVNEAGGVLGMPVEIVYGDSATSPATAVSEARRLLDVEGVSLFIGPASSPEALAVAQEVTIPRGVLLMSPSATSPALTAMSDGDYVFRTIASDATQGVVLAKLAVQRGFQTACVMYGNYAYAFNQGIADRLAASFTAMGGQVLAAVSHEGGQSSYAAELQACTQNDPDVLVAISDPVDAQTYLIEAISGGLASQFLLADQAKDQSTITSIEAAAGAGSLEGTLGTAPANVTSAVLESEYQAAYGTPVPPYVGEVYDAVALAALAAQQAKSTRSAAIRDALRAVAGEPGVEVGACSRGIAFALRILRSRGEVDYVGKTGAVDFGWDGNGDATSAVVEVWTVRSGLIEHVRNEAVGALSSTVCLPGKDNR